jgi:hypothetical protein
MARDSDRNLGPQGKALAELHRREQAEAKVQRERDERAERKLLAKLEAEERKGSVDPPPELSPSEKRERETAERLDALEGKTAPSFAHQLNAESPEENRDREALRLLRIRKAAEAQDEHNRQYAQRVSSQVSKLQREIARHESETAALVEQYRGVLAERDGALQQKRYQLGELQRSLSPGETTKDRLRALELTA